MFLWQQYSYSVVIPNYELWLSWEEAIYQAHDPNHPTWWNLWNIILTSQEKEEWLGN